MDPRLGAALLASGRLGCSEEAATVVAMLGVHSIWAGPRGQRKALEDAKAKCALPIPFSYRGQGMHVHGSIPFPHTWQGKACSWLHPFTHGKARHVRRVWQRTEHLICLQAVAWLRKAVCKAFLHMPDSHHLAHHIMILNRIMRSHHHGHNFMIFNRILRCIVVSRRFQELSPNRN